MDDSNTFDWIKFISIVNLNLTGGDGIKKVKVTFRDNLARIIGTVETSIELDQNPPVINDVKTSKNAYSAGKNVEIIVESGKRESGLEGMVQVKSISTGYDSGVQKTFERTVGEYVYIWDTTGLKEGQDYKVEATLTDKAGWKAKDQRLAITIDNTPPEGGNIVINNGEAFTQKRSVEITFDMPKDAIDVFVEGDILADSNTFQWIPISKLPQPLIVNLNVGDGNKTIKARFRDEAGNETKPFEKTITLNETPPVILSVNSQDEGNPADNDEIYHAGQIIKIVIKVDDREKNQLEAWANITSQKTEYDSGILAAKRDTDTDFTVIWNTSSLPEASDYIVNATLQDSFGQRTMDNSLIINIDNTPPQQPKVYIDGGKEITNSRNVKLSLFEIDKDAKEMFVAGDVSENFNAFQWIPLVDTKEIELSEGNGTKVINVKLRDSAGNVSKEASATIILDRAVPSSLSISINSGAKYTESHDIKVKLSAKSAREMFISGSIVKNDNTFQWIPYQEEINLRLTQGEGEKSVRARFRNGTDNESAEVEAKITLDISPPVIKSIKVFDVDDKNDDDGVYHSGQKIEFQASSEGNEANLKGFIVIKGTTAREFSTGRQEMTSQGLGVYTYIWNTESASDGKYLCEVNFEDIAGHSAIGTLELAIDNQGPENPSITVKDKQSVVYSRTVEFNIRADGDPAEIFIGGDVINDDSTFRWIPYTTDKLSDDMILSLNLKGTDGNKKVTAIFRDNAKSESSVTETSVILEFKRPELTDSCRVVQTNDDPSQAYLSLQFDEPVKRIDPNYFSVTLKDKYNPNNSVQLDETNTQPALSDTTVMVEIPSQQLEEIRQWQPMSYSYSYIQAEIAENGVYDLADKGNKSNQGKPADVYFALPASSISMDAKPASFSPNEDGVKDKTAIAYTLSQRSDVSIRIMDQQNEIVKEWWIEDQTGGLAYSLEWNGKKNDGSICQDGEYSVVIISTGVGADGNSYGLKRKIVVDTSPPQILNINPLTGSKITPLLRASISVVDTPKASGIEMIYVTVLGDTESKFPMVKSDMEGGYVIPANSEINLPIGKQSITFHVLDIAGNKAEKSMDYTVVSSMEVTLSLMNFPNPFSAGGQTNIRYSLPDDIRKGKLIIYDAGGDVIFLKDLMNQELENGEHTLPWDGKDIYGNLLSRGVYFCRLWIDREDGDQSRIHKIAIR